MVRPLHFPEREPVAYSPVREVGRRTFSWIKESPCKTVGILSILVGLGLLYKFREELCVKFKKFLSKEPVNEPGNKSPKSHTPHPE